jgi:AraC-like DNA-binding protein
MEKNLKLNLPEKPKENTLLEYAEAQLTIREFNLSFRPQEVEGRYPLRLKDSLLIVVLSGKIYIDMNYQSHTLEKHTVVQLTEDDIILNITHSADFAGYLILISPELRSEIKSMTAGVRLQKASRLKRAYPIQKLDDKEFNRVVERIRSTQSYISDETHLYRSLIIRNEVWNLFMELDNSRTKKYGDEEVELSHAELLRERFREMLVQQCRQHRDVGHYARELCVTTDYLSRVIREFDGSSAMKWIATAVVTEAKYLMRQPGKTINQIALGMNFPDQSTFGKFFKKHTGKSPKEYKKES